MFLGGAKLANAEELTRYVSVDYPERVKVYVEIWDETTYQTVRTDIELGDDNLYTITGPSSGVNIHIDARDGYKLVSVMNGTSSKYPSDWDCNFYMSEGDSEDTYVVETEELTPVANFTLTVDDPTLVRGFTSSYREISIEGTSQTVNLYEGETQVRFASQDGSKPLYKVTKNGEEVALTWGQYYVELYDEANSTYEENVTVDIKANFPEEDVAVKIKFSDDSTEGITVADIVTEVTVDGEPVELAADGSYTVRLGKEFALKVDMKNYNFNGSTCNGSAISFNSYSGGSYAFYVTKESEIILNAVEKPLYTVTLIVDNASAIAVYEDEKTEENRLEIADGENILKIRQDVMLYVSPGEGIINTVYVDGNYDYNYYQWGFGDYTTTIYSDKKIEVSATKIDRDREMAVYVEGYTSDMWISMQFRGSYMNIENVADGYRTVRFGEGDGKLSISMYDYTGGSLQDAVYLNGVKQEGNYMSYELEVADGDVLKIYCNGEPTEVTATFTGNATSGDYRIVADKITEVSAAEGVYTAFANTELLIYPLNERLVVTADGTALELTGEEGDQCYVYTLAADATIDLSLEEEPDEPDPIPVPEHLYIFGTVDGNNWTPAEAIEMDKADKVFTYTGSIDAEGDGYFAFTEVQSSDWATVNAARWSGSEGADQPVVLDSEIELVYGVDASLKLVAGYYEFKVVFDDYVVNLTVTAKEKPGDGIDDISADASSQAEYFNLQGIRVVNPAAGNIYIVRRGENVTKELVK